MPPRLKPQVSLNPEEEGGVRSWSLENPATATRLRIYEDEYRMAMAMDGTRSLAEAVQYLRNAGVAVGETDLHRFFRELVVMGLAEETQPGPEGLSPIVEGPTPAEGQAETPSPEAARTERMTLIDDPDVISGRDGSALDPMTVLLGLSGPVDSQDAHLSSEDASQLKEDALTHVGRGEIAHARDSLLVLFEAYPKMPHVREALGLLETMGERPTTEELAGMLAQLARWFPPSAGEGKARVTLTPARPLALGFEASRTLETKRPSFLGAQGRPSRRFWIGLAAGVTAVVVVLGATWVDFGALVGGPAEAVRTLRVERMRLPQLSALNATSIGPAEQAVLRAPSGGVVTCALPTGQRARLAEVVARLRASYSRKGRPSEPAGKRANSRLRAQATERRQRFEALVARFEQARAGNTLATLGPKDRARHLARARQAERSLSDARAREALFAPRASPDARSPNDVLIRASYDGEVIQSRRPGDFVRQGDSVVTLARHGHVRIHFNKMLVEKPQTGELEVVISGGPPIAGRFVPEANGQAAGGFQVEVADSAGALLHISPKEVRLVSAYVPNTMQVPKSALVPGASADVFVLWHVLRGRLAAEEVRSLGSGSEQEATVVSAQGTLPASLNIVTATAQGKPLAQLQTGQRVRQAGD